jgi:hypothetical protein
VAKYDQSAAKKYLNSLKTKNALILNFFIKNSLKLLHVGSSLPLSGLFSEQIVTSQWPTGWRCPHLTKLEEKKNDSLNSPPNKKI